MHNDDHEARSNLGGVWYPRRGRAQQPLPRPGTAALAVAEHDDHNPRRGRTRRLQPSPRPGTTILATAKGSNLRHSRAQRPSPRPSTSTSPRPGAATLAVAPQAATMTFATVGHGDPRHGQTQQVTLGRPPLMATLARKLKLSTQLS